MKQVKQSLGNKDLQDTFNALLGGGKKDLRIIWPKFKKLRYQVGRCLKLFEWLISQEWLAAHFPEEMRIINLYKDQLVVEYSDRFTSVVDFDRFGSELEIAMVSEKEEERLDHVPNFSSAPPEALELFQTIYPLAVESDLVSTFVVTCKNLTNFKASLEDREKISLKFLRQACMRFTPIPKLAAANFKAFFEHPDGTDASREGIAIFLHTLYRVTHDVYEAASLPDINVDDFADIVRSSLEELRRHLPDCGDALGKISDSIGLLKRNFSSYYRDMQGSKNPGLILEHYVRDVATNTKSSVNVRVQFGKIIKFYRNAASQRPMDAKARSIFSEIDSNFSKLEKRSTDEDGEAAAAADAAGAAKLDEVTGGAPPPVIEPLIQAAPGVETAEEREARKKAIAKNSKKRAKARKAASQRIHSALESDLGESAVPNALLQHLLQGRGDAAE